MQQERASKKQHELLQFVDDFIQGNGYGPSYREIMRALGYKSVSTVAIHIDGLIAKGYLARRDKSARSLEVVSATSVKPDKPVDAPVEALIRERLARHTLSDDERIQVQRALKLIGIELPEDSDAS